MFFGCVSLHSLLVPCVSARPLTILTLDPLLLPSAPPVTCRLPGHYRSGSHKNDSSVTVCSRLCHLKSLSFFCGIQRRIINRASKLLFFNAVQVNGDCGCRATLDDLNNTMTPEVCNVVCTVILNDGHHSVITCKTQPTL